MGTFLCRLEKPEKMGRKESVGVGVKGRRRWERVWGVIRIRFA